MDFYVYILYSKSSDRYYVGSSNDPWKRLNSHNCIDRSTFTSKYRPWHLVATFKSGQSRGEAVKIERWIKKQKSRLLIKKLLDTQYNPSGSLAKLVRVPHVRD